MTDSVREFKLVRDGDQVFLVYSDSGARTPVKPVWARPLSASGEQISFVGPKKEEVLLLDSLGGLDDASRRIAEEEIARRYILPRITRVISAVAHFGVRYWHVETDKGERKFALKNAAKNAVWLSDEHLVLNDTFGCRYEVRPFSQLDARSRAEIEKVL